MQERFLHIGAVLGEAGGTRDATAGCDVGVRESREGGNGGDLRHEVGRDGVRLGAHDGASGPSCGRIRVDGCGKARLNTSFRRRRS